MYKIERCAACGEGHEVEAKTVNARRALYTHWYECPTNGDPVSFRISQAGENTRVIMDAIAKSLETADAADAFLVAVFHPFDSSQRVKLFRHTHNFPHHLFSKCVDTLRQNLDQEAGELPEVELPMGVPRRRRDITLQESAE